jgi:hypothetical protein
MSFADPNGEIQTLHGSVELAPSGVVAGIKVKDWASVAGQGPVEVVTLDTQGKPVADVPVKLMAKRRIDYSHRKRIVGGFYAYEHHTEFKDLGEICKGKSDCARQIPVCDARRASRQRLSARRNERQGGNVFYAGTSYWVAGQGDLWFTAGNQDRIDVIPEKRSYAPGETARLQVRTPFREATALVSIEAGGIIDTQVVAAVALQAGDRVAGQGRVGAERVCLGARRARPRRAAQVVLASSRGAGASRRRGSRSGGIRRSRRRWSIWPNRRTRSGWRTSRSASRRSSSRSR